MGRWGEFLLGISSLKKDVTFEMESLELPSNQGKKRNRPSYLAFVT